MEDIINGVDTRALRETIEAVKADPGLAHFEFRIFNEWMGGGLNRTTIYDFYGTRQRIAHETAFVIYNDEPPALLSGDAGPNPVENLLHALAGCLTTSIVSRGSRPKSRPSRCRSARPASKRNWENRSKRSAIRSARPTALMP
jgi:hypothetical protein